MWQSGIRVGLHQVNTSDNFPDIINPMPPVYHQAPVVSCRQLSTTYYEVIARPENPLDFIPGQYLITRINPQRVSQYSLASRPNASTFTLLVDVSPGGESSQYFQSLQTGDTLEYLPPLGNFIFQSQDQSTHLLFLATGTGVAPFISMIDSLVQKKDPRPIHLFFGLRNQEDIFYQSVLDDFHNSHPNFNYSISLSDPAPGWTTLAGYITNHVQTAHFPPASTSAYLCGSPSMIKDTQVRLLEQGFDPHKIYFEKYW